MNARSHRSAGIPVRCDACCTVRSCVVSYVDFSASGATMGNWCIKRPTFSLGLLRDALGIITRVNTLHYAGAQMSCIYAHDNWCIHKWQRCALRFNVGRSCESRERNGRHRFLPDSHAKYMIGYLYSFSYSKNKIKASFRERRQHVEPPLIAQFVLHTCPPLSVCPNTRGRMIHKPTVWFFLTPPPMTTTKMSHLDALEANANRRSRQQNAHTSMFCRR